MENSASHPLNLDGKETIDKLTETISNDLENYVDAENREELEAFITEGIEDFTSEYIAKLVSAITDNILNQHAKLFDLVDEE